MTLKQLLQSVMLNHIQAILLQPVTCTLLCLDGFYYTNHLHRENISVALALCSQQETTQQQMSEICFLLLKLYSKMLKAKKFS